MKHIFVFIISRNLFLLYISLFCIYFPKNIRFFLDKQLRRVISSASSALPEGFEALILKHSNDNIEFIGYLSGIITIFFSGLLLLKCNNNFEALIFLIAFLYIILVVVVVIIFTVKSGGNLLSAKIGHGKLRRFSYSTIIDRLLDLCNFAILIILIIVF